VIDLAGTPTAVTPSGKSFKTTEPAPILTLCPILIFPKITTLDPIKTFFPNLGCLS
jgi:hypothetical protein